MKARLYEKYKNEVVPALKQVLANVEERLNRSRNGLICREHGDSTASLEKGAMDDAAKEPDLCITGRKRLSQSANRARRLRSSLAREPAMPIACCRVTLRKDAMYEFSTWLVRRARCPRIRDFLRDCRRASLTVAAITRSAVAINHFFRKSNWKRSSARKAWTLRS